MNDFNDINDINEIGIIKENDLSHYDISQEKIIGLEARIKTLGDICNEINPYAEITDEQKMKLMDFNILDFNDPFKITNTLLMLLEDTIDELHILKPFDENQSSVKEIL